MHLPPGHSRANICLLHADCADACLVLVWLLLVWCRHGPKRAAYVGDFWKVVDWAQVSKNFELAKAGKVEQMVA